MKVIIPVKNITASPKTSISMEGIKIVHQKQKIIKYPSDMMGDSKITSRRGRVKMNVVGCEIACMCGANVNKIW
jgi:hypothetical protein